MPINGLLIDTQFLCLNGEAHSRTNKHQGQQGDDFSKGVGRILLSQYFCSESSRGNAERPFKENSAREALAQLRKTDAALASLLDLKNSLKPEVALLLELYEANLEGRAMTVSVLGLIDGIAPTTTLRYLDLLQSKGAVQRVAHEHDNRMTYVELTQNAKAEIDRVLQRE